MNRIDLNGDLGEGIGQDTALLRHLSSVNIACGGHAGDEHTMRVTVASALAAGVALGAHPGYPDRVHFGRRETGDPPARIIELVASQVMLLQQVAAEIGGRITHVKVHGALYLRAMQDEAAAAAVVRGVQLSGRVPVIFAMAGSELERAATAAGFRVVREGFVDRSYLPDGRLTPRSHLQALRLGEAAAAQALQLVQQGGVTSVDGSWVPMPVETLCLHGDQSHAVDSMKALRRALAAADVRVASYLVP